ncbi:S41 family peptidase [Flavobacterium sp. WC2509]|uniref:S41 family peptidase n=1 Tax=Flavobacterium sp. WC2509 TaxID=3461406 RepID=UPI0040440D4E
MKTCFKVTLLIFLAFLTLQSCDDMDDGYPSSTIETNDFIWKGLNLYYLWQADVPNLADKRFANQADLNSFLQQYEKPEDLFNALRVDKSIDRFSWIVSDYLTLEGQLQGTTKNNGMEYGLYYKSANSSVIFGFVSYIIPNSDASTKDIKRGDIFYGVNGTQLTDKNYKDLFLNSENYNLNLADYNNGAITPNGKTVSLTKTTLAENPIFINKVIETGGHKIGYLMYNGFYPSYDTQLNTTFSSLKSKGVTDLVLDLRYNSGGSIESATRLASMITGQFTGKVFSKERWNDKINSYFESEDPTSLINLFTNTVGSTPLNSLNLTKVYILTTKSTASASELVINGLKPYITVVQIGDMTTGKNVGSITIYDSPTFGKKNRNPNHRYAMQPIVLKIVNADGFGDYLNGLTPTYTLKENLANLGELGNSTEPLLSTAIGKITGTAKMVKTTQGKTFPYFKDAKSIIKQNQMYIDKVPAGLLKSLE